MHLQFGEIPFSLSLLLKGSLGTLLQGMQRERGGGHQVVKEMQSILAGVSLELRSAGYKKELKRAAERQVRQTAGWKRRGGVKPWLDPASAHVEGAKLHPSALSGFWMPWL